MKSTMPLEALGLEISKEATSMNRRHYVMPSSVFFNRWAFSYLPQMLPYLFNPLELPAPSLPRAPSSGQERPSSLANESAAYNLDPYEFF